jgi:hypothetical protein
MPYRDPDDRRANDLSRRIMLDEARRRCPECGELRRTEETLRAHRYIAHGIESVAA